MQQKQMQIVAMRYEQTHNIKWHNIWSVII